MRYTDEQLIKKRTGVIITLLIVCLMAQIWTICRIYGFEDRYSREFSGKEPETGLYQNAGKRYKDLIDETSSVEKALYPELNPDMEALTAGNLSQGSMISIINQLLKYYECTAKQFKKERGA